MKQRDFGLSAQSNDPRNSLRLWMMDVVGLLDELLDTGQLAHRTPRVILARMTESAASAWREERPGVVLLIESIDKIPEKRLISHGLGGLRLNFKLSAIHAAYERFLRTRVGRHLATFFDVVSAVLESVFDKKAGALIEFLATLKAVLLEGRRRSA